MHYFPLLLVLLLPISTTNVLFDFSEKADIRSWRVIDDVVMGGRSAGTFSLNDEGHGVFAGTVSLENNGGFSSVRYYAGEVAIDGKTKVYLRLKGDGKEYQFRIKSDVRDWYSYIMPFSTTGEWQEVEIPLDNMYPSFRGRKLSRSNFNGDYLEEITFLIGNKKNESFELQIDAIELR